MSDLVSSVERKKLVGEIASVLPADFEPISIISLSLPLSLFFLSLSVSPFSINLLYDRYFVCLPFLALP